MSESVIAGETVPTTEEVITEPSTPKKTFPTKKFVSYAVACTAAALLGGYVVKKTSCKDEDEEEDRDGGWTITKAYDPADSPTTD